MIEPSPEAREEEIKRNRQYHEKFLALAPRLGDVSLCNIAWLEPGRCSLLPKDTRQGIGNFLLDYALFNTGTPPETVGQIGPWAGYVPDEAADTAPDAEMATVIPFTGAPAKLRQGSREPEGTGGATIYYLADYMQSATAETGMGDGFAGADGVGDGYDGGGSGGGEE